MDKEKSNIPYEYLDFLYDLSNKYLFPIEEKDLKEALKLTNDFIDSHTNSAS